MSSKPWMAALLWVVAVVALSALTGSIATTTTVGTTASPYSGCPPTTPVGCNCEEDSDGPVVTVNATEGAIDSCMTSLSESGHTSLFRLSVNKYPDLSLTEDIFKLVQFEQLTFDDTTIVHVDKNFLGSSRSITKSIAFIVCPLLEGFPKIDADVLTRLDLRYVFDDSNLNPTLPRNIFSGTPALEDINIYSAEDPHVLTIQRDVFRSLTKLQTVSLSCSVRIRWGAGHFAAPGLERLQIGSQWGTVEVDPGSFSGIPAGATIEMRGQLSGDWSPTKFFNVLSAGAILRIPYESQDCGCDLAWIRYSSFLGQVTLICKRTGLSDIALNLLDLSHCPFYKDQSLHTAEL